MPTDKPTCNISPDLFKAWQILTRRKDSEKICKLYGYSRPTIDKALNYGRVDRPEVKEKINEFFAERLEAENQEANKLLALNAQLSESKQEN